MQRLHDQRHGTLGSRPRTQPEATWSQRPRGSRSGAPDPSGTQQSVNFTGTASGTSLTGTLTVNGAAEQVPATIGSDGSVSGTLLNPDGSKYGVFWGRPSGPKSMQGASTSTARWGMDGAAAGAGAEVVK